MNTAQLSKDFLALFEADETFAGKNFVIGQTASDFEVPALVFNVNDKPMTASGKAGAFTLTLGVHSSSTVATGGNPDDVHAATVAAVEDKLLGSGKAALLAALNALGRWDLRGWIITSDTPGVEGLRFVTPVIVEGVGIEL
jgi:hypothetical protein